jgi:hypothetical protein
MTYFLLGIILLGIILLAAPVYLGYDSPEKRIKVRWLGLTIAWRLGREKSAKPKKPKKNSESRIDEEKSYSLRVMRSLWRQRDLVRELIRKLLELALEVCRTLSFRDSVAAISLPDPMLNGMFYAVISNIDLQEVHLSVNFEERNYAKIRVTVYPYRVVGKLALFLLDFPYIRTIRLAWALKKQYRAG